MMDSLTGRMIDEPSSAETAWENHPEDGETRRSSVKFGTAIRCEPLTVDQFELRWRT